MARLGRGGNGRGRRGPAAVLAGSLFAAACGVTGAVMPVASAQLTTQVLDVATIRSEQRAVVNLNHQLPIGEARFAVDQLAAALTGDQQALAAAQAQAQGAAARLQQATSRLGADSAALAATQAALAADQSRLGADRAALRSIAIGMYTGELTNPQPTSLAQLEAEQQKVIDAAEVESVSAVVVANLGRDLAAATTDGRRRDRLVGQVGQDSTLVDEARGQQASAEDRAGSAGRAMGTDRDRLATAQAQLVSAQASLTADLTALGGPAPTGALSLIGGPALDAGQMAAWFQNQGYLDLTTAPVQQLAAWYLQAGAAEGIRGDVAFAQALLETGGFSSPDSVTLNNYAGIGHCDTCAAGWAFPSPQGGVVGQEQLLRIFADGALPAGGPAPVLPSLVPARQGRRGCCATWESLTGVWASDPTYASHILGIYQQMLAFALSRPAD